MQLEEFRSTSSS